MWDRVARNGTIICGLIGGLGNQMFQYAAARALALRRGARVKLDLSGFAKYRLRRYELDSYPIKATLATAEEVARFLAPAARADRLSRLLQRSGLSARPVCYREPHFHFDPGLAKQKPPVFLSGYWQSERYFADAADIIRRELSPREPLEPENAGFALQIAQTYAVSLHVRRGDYVTNAHTNAYHGVCPPDYYRRAIDHVRGYVPDAHLFVFSDDPEWTAANLRPDLPTTYVTANPDRGFRDLQLMSLCRHHIIANSAFSWWGAWLNPRPDKIVVAPQRWFAETGNDTRDLLPESWVRL